MNLHQKLVEIRKEIDVLKKDTQGYNYSYVSGSQVLGKIQAKKDELGVLLYPVVKNMEHSTFDYKQYNKNTEQMEDKTDFVVSGVLQYVWQNADDPTDRLVVDWMLYGQQDDISKAFGSGLTYSERYFLLKFFNIPTDDEDPDTRQDPKGSGTYGNNKATEKQIDFVTNLIKRNVKGREQQLAYLNKMIQELKLPSKMTDWTSQQASQAIKYLQSDANA